MPQRVLEYDEIELRIERSADDGYVTRATTGDGVAEAPFDLPFTRDRIDYLVLKAAMPRRGVRRMESSALREVTELGDGLFKAIFREDVRDLYRTALAHADRDDRGLRIRLALTDVPELTGLPWEYLYEEPGFLAISRLTPVVRYLDLARTRRPREIEPPLRILAMVSSPSDAARLDVEQERANLEQALSELVAQGAVEIHWLERAMLTALLEELRDDTFHILHYIGHGTYKPEVQDGVLLLEDEAQRGHEVSSRRIGAILHDHDSLRLAVLNSCEGARSSEEDPFSGVAGTLMQQGIPAVIAMQFEITDRAAIVFAQHLYDALAEGLPIDAALTEARKAIWADDNDVEWGTPVLFMRIRDGHLFTVRVPPSAQEIETVAPQLPGSIEPVAPPETRERPSLKSWWRLVRQPRVLGALLALVVTAVVAGFILLREGGGSPSGSWAKEPGLPVALEGASAAPFDGRLWVVGGISAGQGRPILNRVDIYDPGTRSWRSGPPLPVPLYYAALTSTDTALYLLGGISPSGAVSTVYRLDSPTGSWQNAGQLPAARGGGAGAWDGHRLVFGGGVGTDHRAAGDVWALEDGDWRRLGGLQPPREKLASATDGNGTVWFLAGRDPNVQANAFPAVEVAKAESVNRTGQVTAVQGAAAVWWPSAGVCMIGGQAGSGFSGNVECLDHDAHIPDLPTPRAGLAAAVVGNTVFVVGGYDAGNHGTRTVESFEVPPNQ